jgi:NitT/TauT family transport system substrate-binding protein
MIDGVSIILHRREEINMKKLMIGSLIMLLGLVLTGCSQQKSSQAPARTITIGVMPDVESVPFLIAEKNGYFSKYGVDVKIVHFSAAKDRDSALQSGQLDGVVTDMLAVLFMNEGGIDLKICAKNDGNVELMAGKGSPIATIAELKGKSIGLSTNTIMEYTADNMLTAGGVNPADVKKVAIPQLPTRLEMLQGGKVDAAILPEPLAGLAVKNGARVLASTDVMGGKAGAIAFTGKVLKENPGEIKAVFRAYNDAVVYLAAEPSASYLDYVIQAQSFPVEIKDSLQLPKYTPAALPSEPVFSDVVQWMKDRGLIKGSYAYKDLVDDTVLR